MAETNTSPDTNFIFDKENNCYLCEGSWSVLKIDDLLSRVDFTILPQDKTIKISGKHIKPL